MEALEEHRGVERLGRGEGQHVALHHGDASGTLAPVLDEAAELLVELHRRDVEPRRHHVLRQVPPPRAELDDPPSPGTRRHHLGQAIEEVAAGHQVAADERQRPALVRERAGQGGRQVERRGLVGRVVAGAARDARDRAPTSTPGRPPRTDPPAAPWAARPRSRRAGHGPGRSRRPSARWPGPARRRARRARRGAVPASRGRRAPSAGGAGGGRRPPGRRCAPARDWTGPWERDATGPPGGCGPQSPVSGGAGAGSRPRWRPAPSRRRCR